MKRPSFVVIGGAGFIGSALVRGLLEFKKGAQVLVIDNLSSGKKENIPPEAFFLPLDLAKESPGEISKAIAGAEAVFHLASNASVPRGGIDRFVDLRNNVEGTVRLLEACALSGSVRKISLASSSAVYGLRSGKRPSETAPCEPISMYGASKLACEGYLSAYCNNFGFEGSVFRIANIVGGRQERGVLHDIFSRKGNCALFGKGAEKKSYLHVNDCVSGILAGTFSSGSGTGKVDTFNLGSDSSISVKAISEIASREILNRTGSKPDLSFSGKPSWPGDVPEMLLNCKKLKKIGWNPELKKSRDAIERAAEELSDRWLGK